MSSSTSQSLNKPNQPLRPIASQLRNKYRYYYLTSKGVKGEDSIFDPHFEADLIFEASNSEMNDNAYTSLHSTELGMFVDFEAKKFDYNNERDQEEKDFEAKRILIERFQASKMMINFKHFEKEILKKLDKNGDGKLVLNNGEVFNIDEYEKRTNIDMDFQFVLYSPEKMKGIIQHPINPVQTHPLPSISTTLTQSQPINDNSSLQPQENAMDTIQLIFSELAYPIEPITPQPLEEMTQETIEPMAKKIIKKRKAKGRRGARNKNKVEEKDDERDERDERDENDERNSQSIDDFSSQLPPPPPPPPIDPIDFSYFTPLPSMNPFKTDVELVDEPIQVPNWLKEKIPVFDFDAQGIEMIKNEEYYRDIRKQEIYQNVNNPNPSRLFIDKNTKSRPKFPKFQKFQTFSKYFPPQKSRHSASTTTPLTTNTDRPTATTTKPRPRARQPHHDGILSLSPSNTINNTPTTSTTDPPRRRPRPVIESADAVSRSTRSRQNPSLISSQYTQSQHDDLTQSTPTYDDPRAYVKLGDTSSSPYIQHNDPPKPQAGKRKKKNEQTPPLGSVITSDALNKEEVGDYFRQNQQKYKEWKEGIQVKPSNAIEFGVTLGLQVQNQFPSHPQQQQQQQQYPSYPQSYQQPYYNQEYYQQPSVLSQQQQQQQQQFFGDNSAIPTQQSLSQEPSVTQSYQNYISTLYYQYPHLYQQMYGNYQPVYQHGDPNQQYQYYPHQYAYIPQNDPNYAQNANQPQQPQQQLQQQQPQDPQSGQQYGYQGQFAQPGAGVLYDPTHPYYQHQQQHYDGMAYGQTPQGTQYMTERGAVAGDGSGENQVGDSGQKQNQSAVVTNNAPNDQVYSDLGMNMNNPNQYYQNMAYPYHSQYYAHMNPQLVYLGYPDYGMQFIPSNEQAQQQQQQQQLQGQNQTAPVTEQNNL